MHRIFDYSAKSRREYELPVCTPNGDVDDLQATDDEVFNGMSLVGETSLSSLFGRQVVGGDDYSCAPDRPCKNGACCPKETLQCNYGEEYIFPSEIAIRLIAQADLFPATAARMVNLPMMCAGPIAMPKQSAAPMPQYQARSAHSTFAVESE